MGIQKKKRKELSTYYAHPCTFYSNHVLDGDIALCLVETVSTRLVKGTKVLSVEAGDVYLSAQRVVLEDLVGCVACASANDTELRIQAL